MKKKVLALILSSVMALSLIGCGSDNAQPSTDTPATEDTTTSTEDSAPAEAETEAAVLPA